MFFSEEDCIFDFQVLGGPVISAMGHVNNVDMSKTTHNTLERRQLKKRYENVHFCALWKQLIFLHFLKVFKSFPSNGKKLETNQLLVDDNKQTLFITLSGGGGGGGA